MAAWRRWQAVTVLAVAIVTLYGCGQAPHVVHISSEPSGAMVFYNDRVIGETPMDTIIEDRPGDYSVYSFRVVKEDYLPERRVFKEQLYHQTAAELLPPAMHFVLEQRKKFSINITSEPSGALITLNGEVLGEAPLVATMRERVGNPRVFEFVAAKEGYALARQELREFLPREDGTVFVFPETMHFALQPQ